MARRKTRRAEGFDERREGWGAKGRKGGEWGEEGGRRN